MALPWTIICIRKCFAFVQDRHLDSIFLCLFHYSVTTFSLDTYIAALLLLEVKNILIFYSTGIVIAQERGKY